MMKFYLLTRHVLIIGLLLTGITGWAQQAKVTGRVTSLDDGTGLPGVSILEKGTSNGTVTDAGGNYSINVSSGDATLIFSFVGYASQEAIVARRSTIDVVLVPDVTALSEIVVVGYGVKEKKDVTGVVAAVDAKNFNRGAIVSPDQLIAGKVAGVQITANGGEPGGGASVRIRGGTSITASNEPLYVIDGVPIDNSLSNGGRNPLNFINPGDIETFTVLKDASAAAIYGSRAANGVIIITTKKGKAGELSVTYDGWYSVGKIAQKLDVFNASQFREIMAAKAPDRLSLLSPEDDNINTNWQDQVYRKAVGQNNTVTVSGGNETATFRFSLGDLRQQGILKKSETKRTSFSMGLGTNFFNKSLKIDVNLKGSQTNDIFPGGGPVGNAASMAPTQPVYDPASIYGGYWEWENNLGTKNPVAELNLVNDQARTNRSIGNIQIDYALPVIKGLRANLNLGYDISDGNRKRFTPTYTRSQVTFQDVDEDGALDTLMRGEIWREEIHRMNKLLEFYGNYAKDLPSIDAKFDVTAGYSYQDFSAEYPSITADTLTTNNFSFNNLAVAKNYRATNSIEESRLISFFGRVNFTFRDRYILTASIRRDGSSRFGPLNRWGTFPAAAFAWRVYDEAFMEGLHTVFSDMKLRVGFGINGNQEIGNYKYLPTYEQSDLEAQYQFGDSFYYTIRPNGYDESIKWEETQSLNIGLDYGVLGGRINGSLEFYQKNTSDLLFEVTVAAGSNLTNIILSNIGKVRNRGIELSVDALAVSTPDLRWNIGFNISANKNKILALDGSDDPTFQGYQTGGISGGVGNNIQILKVGQPVNAFWVYRHKMGTDGKPLADGFDYNEDGVANDLDIYEDLNGDDKVDDKDRAPYKQSAPTLIMGLTSTVNYKNFDLSFTLRSNVGNYVYNNVAAAMGYYNRVTSAEQVPTNMVTSVIESNFTKAQPFSNYYVENASFVRMDNLSVGFTPSKLPSNLKVRVYGTVQNLFVLTKYSGLDPEIGKVANAETPTIGIDNNLYPRARTFIIGLSIGL